MAGSIANGFGTTLCSKNSFTSTYAWSVREDFLAGTQTALSRGSSSAMIVSRTRPRSLIRVLHGSVKLAIPSAGRENKMRSTLRNRMQPTAQANDVRRHKARKAATPPYAPPASVLTASLGDLLKDVRQIPENQQERLGISVGSGNGAKLWLAGDLSLIKLPCVAVVGARRVSREGASRARRLARELVRAGIVVVSGLAKGVDTEALTAAMEAGGKTIGVIGTPLDKAYPAENKRLQEKTYGEHLLISQFPPGKSVYQSNFPERNKLMAALSDATVIVEASDTSGSLHQAAECVRLGRWLFIANSLMDDPSLRWPKDFAGYPNTRILTQTSQIIELIR